MTEQSKLYTYLKKQVDAQSSIFKKRDVILQARKDIELINDDLIKLLFNASNSQFLLTGSMPDNTPVTKPKAVNKPKRAEPLLEGFWASKYESNYPDVRKLAGKRAFKGKSEVLAVLAEIEPVAARDAYKGMSTCRICGCRNGSSTYKSNGLHWPSGYRHYIEKHNVKPTAAFVDMLQTLPAGKKILKNVEVATRKPTDGWILGNNWTNKPTAKKSELSKALTTLIKMK